MPRNYPARSKNCTDHVAVSGPPTKQSQTRHTHERRHILVSRGAVTVQFVSPRFPTPIPGPPRTSPSPRNRAHAFVNRNCPAFAAIADAETRLPVSDLTDEWARRSTDYALVGVTPDVIATRQRAADAFPKPGVLDRPADVAKLWDPRFNDGLAKGAAKLTTQ
jgi:hypothetical protein